MTDVTVTTVHVCWSVPAVDASGLAWLDETERARLDGLRRVEDRRGFLTSRVLLRTLVGTLADVSPALVRMSYDCSRCGRPHGRPVVAGPQDALRWQVSLSHTHDAVMVAATDAGPVGVDVELTAATGFAGFDEVALTAGERTEVERGSPEAQTWARAVYWVRKEAVLKATGSGLAVDPCALEVSAPHQPAALTAWLCAQPPPAPVQLSDVPVDDEHVAAVAVLGHSPFKVTLQSPALGSVLTQPRVIR